MMDVMVYITIYSGPIWSDLLGDFQRWQNPLPRSSYTTQCLWHDQRLDRPGYTACIVMICMSIIIIIVNVYNHQIYMHAKYINFILQIHHDEQLLGVGA